MPTIIYENGTNRVVLINPPRNDEDQPILPEGSSYGVREISDEEAAKFNQNGSFTVDSQGIVTVTPAPPAQPDPREQAIAAILDPANGFSHELRTAFAVVVGVDPPAS